MQAELDKGHIEKSLLLNGFVKIPNVLSTSRCEELINSYDNDIYRSTINMQRYNFGRGEYKYYAYPLPDVISKLRNYFYEQLKPAAKEWAVRLKIDCHYPENHTDYLNICHKHDQNLEFGAVNVTSPCRYFVKRGQRMLPPLLYNAFTGFACCLTITLLLFARRL